MGTEEMIGIIPGIVAIGVVGKTAQYALGAGRPRRKRRVRARKHKKR